MEQLSNRDICLEGFDVPKNVILVHSGSRNNHRNVIGPDRRLGDLPGRGIRELFPNFLADIFRRFPPSTPFSALGRSFSSGKALVTVEGFGSRIRIHSPGSHPPSGLPGFRKLRFLGTFSAELRVDTLCTGTSAPSCSSVTNRHLSGFSIPPE